MCGCRGPWLNSCVCQSVCATDIWAQSIPHNSVSSDCLNWASQGLSPPPTTTTLPTLSLSRTHTHWPLFLMAVDMIASLCCLSLPLPLCVRVSSAWSRPVFCPSLSFSKCLSKLADTITLHWRSSPFLFVFCPHFCCHPGKPGMTIRLLPSGV